MFNLSVGDQVRVCWQGVDRKPKGFNCEVLEVGEKALIVEVLVDAPRRIRSIARQGSRFMTRVVSTG
jgi:hypothetical protein